MNSVDTAAVPPPAQAPPPPTGDAVRIAPALPPFRPPQPPPAQPPAARRSRAVQFVTTLSDRRRLAQWMATEVARCGSEKHIATKACRNFPHLFPGNPKANLMRATRIWRQREQLLPVEGDTAAATSALKVHGRVRKHSLPGRGRKRPVWSDRLQKDLLLEYHRLRNAGFPFSAKTVRGTALALLKMGSDVYRHDMKDPRTDKPLPDCVTSRWVRAFADRWQVGLEDRPPGSSVPMYRRKQIDLEDKLVAYHLGCMKRLYERGAVAEESVHVLAPLHFVLNTTTGKSLGFGEQPHLEFTEMMQGARPMTMLLTITGGKDAKVLKPFVVFQDPQRKYPLQGVPDDNQEVTYRTSPSGWVDPQVLASFFEGNTVLGGPNEKPLLFLEPSIWLPFERQLPTAMKDANLDLRYLPKHSAGVLQPMEIGIAQKVKEVWSEGWRDMKKQMIDLGIWNDEGRDASGRMFNAGPRFFLKLVTNAVESVNETKDSDDMSLARKVMIQTGMAMNVNGKWELEQLHPDLQAIATKYRHHFDGQVVTDEEQQQPTPQPQPQENVGDSTFPEEDPEDPQDVALPPVEGTDDVQGVTKESSAEVAMNQQPNQPVQNESQIPMPQSEEQEQASAIATVIAARECAREELPNNTGPT